MYVMINHWHLYQKLEKKKTLEIANNPHLRQGITKYWVVCPQESTSAFIRRYETWTGQHYLSLANLQKTFCCMLLPLVFSFLNDHSLRRVQHRDGQKSEEVNNGKYTGRWPQPSGFVCLIGKWSRDLAVWTLTISTTNVNSTVLGVESANTDLSVALLIYSAEDLVLGLLMC